MHTKQNHFISWQNPRCVQAAHEYAQVNGFDLQIVQDEIYSVIRNTLSPEEQWVLDAFQFDGGGIA